MIIRSQSLHLGKTCAQQCKKTFATQSAICRHSAGHDGSYKINLHWLTRQSAIVDPWSSGECRLRRLFDCYQSGGVLEGWMEDKLSTKLGGWLVTIGAL